MLPKRLFSRRALRDALLAVLGMAALAVAVTLLVYTPQAPRQSLTLTAGSPSGLRHQIAVALAQEARPYGLDLEMVATAGSEEALEQVNAGQIDVALVQGGLEAGDRGNVRQVAALHVEPLHLLVKPELAEEIKKSGFAALGGKTVNLSSIGSGTHTLALELLRFVGLSPADKPGSPGFVPSHVGYGQLLKEPDASRLPDALFTVSALPSPVASWLVEAHGYRLVALPYGDAFSISAVGQLGRDAGPTGGVDKRRVYDTVIPAYTYSVSRAEPPQAIPTLGTRLLVVAHRDVPADAVEHLLEAMFRTAFVQVARPPLEPSLLELAPEFAPHRGNELFRERNKPLIASELVDYLEKSLAIVATVLSGAFFLLQWSKSRARRRRERGFEAYLTQVVSIEQRALELEMLSKMNLRLLLDLQRELGRLKSEAVRKFTEGELEGEHLMTGFLTMVNDARNHITRLLLHERDNVEEQAEAQGRPAEEVWNELIGPLGGSWDEPAKPAS
jgi:TRAP-type uncharacterized transport system substrate-binding protein